MDAEEKEAASMSTKETLPYPNLADELHDWLAVEWPELIRLASPFVWITGSKVWSRAYGLKEPPDADLDIFVMKDPEIPSGAMRIGLLRPIDDGRASTHRALMDHFRTQSIPAAAAEKMKSRTSLGGDRIHTARGSIDIWTCKFSRPEDQLRNYPADSHGQCRMAYCPGTGQLIMLRNPGASAAGKQALLAKRAFEDYLGEELRSAIPPIVVGTLGESRSTLDSLLDKIAARVDSISVPIMPMKYTAVKPSHFNECCPSCGKGVYRGLVSVEHEGGECSGIKKDAVGSHP